MVTRKKFSSNLQVFKSKYINSIASLKKKLHHKIKISTQYTISTIYYTKIHKSYTGEKTTPFSKKHFDMMCSVLLQLNFHLQKFLF